MDRCAPLAAVATEVADALGLVTAVDVTAKESLPPFANTAMDGFAVRSADLSTIPARLQIIETIAPGTPCPVQSTVAQYKVLERSLL